MHYLKFNNFRPGQLEALLPAVHGRDVFVWMPTGGGKSLYVFSTSGYE
jgi:bloom syndrome protein